MLESFSVWKSFIIWLPRKASVLRLPGNSLILWFPRKAWVPIGAGKAWHWWSCASIDNSIHTAMTLEFTGRVCLARAWITFSRSILCPSFSLARPLVDLSVVGLSVLLGLRPNHWLCWNIYPRLRHISDFTSYSRQYVIKYVSSCCDVMYLPHIKKHINWWQESPLNKPYL